MTLFVARVGPSGIIYAERSEGANDATRDTNETMRPTKVI